MKIIQKQLNPSGAYPPIQEWSGATPPDGYYEITADTSEFYNGFIVPTAENGVVTSYTCNTDAWNAWKTTQPQPLSPLEQARADALERISGKCSAAIYSGVNVNGKHYTLSEHEQAALSIAQSKVDKGATEVLYGDGLKDAATITAISAAAYEWGVVCTTYYAYLKQYIAAETDVDKLAAIDFGKALPDSYMQQLAALLNSAGIDITKYKAALTGS